MIPRAHLLIMGVLQLAAIGLALAVYTSLPDPAPVHWNLHGQPDRFGPPWMIAFFMPAAGLFVGLLAIGLPLLGPFRRNFEQFRMTYGRICVALFAAFLILHVIFILKALGRPFAIGPAITVAVGAMLAVLGNWMGKLRRNFWVGIRTPWTLANETVWERTHRVGAKVTVGIGLGWVVAGLFGRDWLCFVALVVGVVVLCVWSLAYSYYCYRRLGSIDELPTAANQDS